MKKIHWTFENLTFSSSSGQSRPYQQDPQCLPCYQIEPFPVPRDNHILDVVQQIVEQSQILQNESSDSCLSSQIFFQGKTSNPSS